MTTLTPYLLFDGNCRQAMEFYKSMLGNYAFMDQIAAIKWIRKNAEAFGGDTNNLTVLGESAFAAGPCRPYFRP